jgi:hypothetical protein
MPGEINKNILQICKLLHPDMLFVTSTVFSFLFLVWLCCRQNRRRILRGIKFMYNENEKRNVTVSQKGNAIQSAALNIHQLFPSRTKDECLLELKKNPSVYRTYLNWPDKWKNRFLEFMEGKKSLPLTYDPFFKKLFNPDVYPERLSRLISSIIGTKVTVKCILSNEDSMLPSTSLLLLDIIVQLEDGSIANVEIQKIPYTFPSERMSCYSADLLLRQYTRVKGERGSIFTYQDLKTVYTIVMFENSPKECKDPELSDIYLHGYVRISVSPGGGCYHVF